MTDDKLRIAFLGTPRFAVPALEALVAAGHEICLVITQPDRPAGRGRQLMAPPVKQAAEQLRLPVFQPEKLATPDALAVFANIDPDVAVVAAYGEILTASTLAIPKRGFLNIHPSLLPRLRGATPVPTAILDGLAITGVSVMEVGLGVDSGPILSQVSEPILDRDTGETLLLRLGELGADLLAATLPDWWNRRITSRRQDGHMATYSRTLRREDGAIDWRRPAVDLWRQCRAFQPWPGFHTTWNGVGLKILAVDLLPSRGGRAPGTVFATPNGWAVACGVGALQLRVVQSQGRKAMPADEFVRGQPAIRDSRLGEVLDSPNVE